MKKKNDYIVIVIVLATILVLGYLLYFNVKKNTEVEVEATIKETGLNYVIAVDEDDNEYKLETNDTYETGDRIKAIVKNIKGKSPFSCEVVDINTISKNIAFSITDIPNSETSDTDTKVDDSSNSVQGADLTTNNEIYNSNNNSNNEVLITNDKSVLDYFNNFYNEVINMDKTTLKRTIKDKFVTLVDFLFYDGEIGGRTYKELSTASKLKVLQIFLKIDNKIEQKITGYKESISSTGNKVYTNAKNKALESYFDLTTNVCSKDQTLCDTAKEGLSDLKESFSLTWGFIKEISGVGIRRLESWYKIWKET